KYLAFTDRPQQSRVPRFFRDRRDDPDAEIAQMIERVPRAGSRHRHSLTGERVDTHLGVQRLRLLKPSLARILIQPSAEGHDITLRALPCRVTRTCPRRSRSLTSTPTIRASSAIIAAISATLRSRSAADEQVVANNNDQMPSS